VEERLETSGTIASMADRQNVWGQRYIDDLILRDRDSDSSSSTGSLGGVSGSGLDERLYALQDPNWNVIGIADTTGSVVERYSYSAYGTPTVLTSAFAASTTGTSSYSWNTLYTGRQYDTETGIYNYRNRYYTAEIGRFLTRDPIGYMGGANLYAYVADNPLIATDPSGLCSPKTLTGLPAVTQAVHDNSATGSNHIMIMGESKRNTYFRSYDPTGEGSGMLVIGGANWADTLAAVEKVRQGSSSCTGILQVAGHAEYGVGTQAGTSGNKETYITGANGEQMGRDLKKAAKLCGDNAGGCVVLLGACHQGDPANGTAVGGTMQAVANGTGCTVIAAQGNSEGFYEKPTGYKNAGMPNPWASLDPLNPNTNNNWTMVKPCP
jgi:RHS repeat-associated protein